MAAAVYAEAEKANGAAAKTRGRLSALSLTTSRAGGGTHQPHRAWLGELLRHRSLGAVLLLRPRLGRDEDAAAPVTQPAAQGLRLATAASRVAVRHAGSPWGLPRAVLRRADRRVSSIGLITLEAKRTGKLLAGNPHEQFDVAGAGNGLHEVPRLPPTLPKERCR